VKIGRIGVSNTKLSFDAISRMTQAERDIVHADPKKKRKKRDSFSAAEKFADDYFSLYIRMRDKDCVTKGMRAGPCSDILQCSHVERRVHKSTRYRPENSYTQCKACHTYHHHQSESPLRLYAESQIGHDGMAMLASLAQKTVIRTPQELREIGFKFKALCDSMRGET